MKRLCAGGLMAAVLLMVTGSAQASSSNPPDYFPGMTGMASCMVCHNSNDSFGGSGHARVEGLPEHFDPGKVYTLTVHVTQPGAQSFGFALYTVDQDGAQAGRILVQDQDLDVRVRQGVTFLKQSFNGVKGDGERSWTFQWQAPEDPSTRVGLYGEVLAGDGHGSVKDDSVYRIEAVVDAAAESMARAESPSSSSSEVQAGD